MSGITQSDGVTNISGISLPTMGLGFNYTKEPTQSFAASLGFSQSENSQYMIMVF